MSDGNEFGKSFAKGVGYAAGGAVVLAGVGALCLLFPPAGLIAAKLTAVGAAAMAGKDISNTLNT